METDRFLRLHLCVSKSKGEYCTSLTLVQSKVCLLLFSPPSRWKKSYSPGLYLKGFTVLLASFLQEAIDSQNDLDWQRKGSNQSCLHGFIQRQAFDGDSVCVYESEKSLNDFDNNSTKHRYLFYGFFNGVDKVQ